MPLLEILITLNALFWMALCDVTDKRRIPRVLSYASVASVAIITILAGRWYDLFVLPLIFGVQIVCDWLKAGSFGRADVYALVIPILGFGLSKGAFAGLIGLVTILGWFYFTNNFKKPVPFIPFVLAGAVVVAGSVI